MWKIRIGPFFVCVDCNDEIPPPKVFDRNAPKASLERPTSSPPESANLLIYFHFPLDFPTFAMRNISQPEGM
jgi:hypothetical protein